MNRKEFELEDMLAPIVEALGCQVWGLEYNAQRKHATLRVYIESDDGVTIDDCERVSRELSARLDVEDPLPVGYTLEVSSPGLDRILFKPEQYQGSVGAEIDVKLAFPFEGRRRFKGRLAGLAGDEVVLRVDDTEYLLPLEQVQRARVVPEFD